MKSFYTVKLSVFLVAVLLLAALPRLGRAQEARPAPPCVYDSAHFSWRHPVPRTRLRPLRPDRPGATETPYTVDAGHVQFETDLLRLRYQPTGTGDPSRRTWYLANALLKLGLGRRTDVQLELPLYNVAQQRPGATAAWTSQRGLGDVALRLKYNFCGDDQQGPLALSAIGYVRAPTGSSGIGDLRPEYGLVLPANVELGDTYNLEAQLEADLLYDPEQALRYVRWMPSVALDRQFGKKLGLLVEGAFPWSAASHDWQPQLNVAPTFNVTGNFQLDAGTHLALNGHTPRQYFVGLTVRR